MDSTPALKEIISRIEELEKNYKSLSTKIEEISAKKAEIPRGLLGARSIDDSSSKIAELEKKVSEIKVATDIVNELNVRVKKLAKSAEQAAIEKYRRSNH